MFRRLIGTRPIPIQTTTITCIILLSSLLLALIMMYDKIISLLSGVILIIWIEFIVTHLEIATLLLLPTSIMAKTLIRASMCFRHSCTTSEFEIVIFNNNSLVCLAIKSTKISFEYISSSRYRYCCCNTILEA